MFFSRRHFLTSAATATAAWYLPPEQTNAATYLDRARRKSDRIKITDIESHEIYIPWHAFNRQELFRYHGHRLRARSIILLRTNVGLTGVGETWSGPFRVTDEQKKRYIGSSPMDFLGLRKDLPFNMAIYDLVGKYLEIPAWKLLGEQVRNQIPVAAWTCSLRPEMMAQEVTHAASLGYRWLKYHVDQVQNVTDQARAMQAVAPEGFKIHLDLNMNGVLQDIEPVLDALKPYSVIGRIEDPIRSDRPQDWKYLCQKYHWPILSHHAPVDFMVRGNADGHMAGHAPVGSAITVAGIADHVKKPFMLQQCGGYINQAFLAHEASVFRMATIDHVNLAELWVDDVVKETMPIDEGAIDVPRGPGLGVTVDEAKLQELARIPKPEYEPFLVKIMYEKGPVILARHNANVGNHVDDMRFLDRLLGDSIPGPRPGYMNQVRTEWMEPDDPMFNKAWQATRDRKFVVVN